MKQKEKANEQRKFTPAPWEFDGREMVESPLGNIGFAMPTDKKKDAKGKIFYPYTQGADLLGDKEENRKANGYLIAAAPEMYHMLNRLLFGAKELLVPDIWQEMERILKKARGEE